MLDPAALAERCRQSHLRPAPDLAPFVSAAWALQWDFGPREAFVQHVLPDPCVQIVVDTDGAYAMGVVTSLFSVTLTGSRFVFGLKFRPGAFYSCTGEPVSTLTNRQVPLGRIFSKADEILLCNLAKAADAPGLMNALESMLRGASPVLDVRLQQVYEIADRIAVDSTIMTVEHAAQLFGLGPRALQRLFRMYVGAGPKWLIRLYRIKEATALIEEGDVGHWADFAVRLGYADQAHFINDFRRLVGRTPARYAGKLKGGLDQSPGR